MYQRRRASPPLHVSNKAWTISLEEIVGVTFAMIHLLVRIASHHQGITPKHSYPQGALIEWGNKDERSNIGLRFTYFQRIPLIILLHVVEDIYIIPYIYIYPRKSPMISPTVGIPIKFLICRAHPVVCDTSAPWVSRRRSRFRRRPLSRSPAETRGSAAADLPARPRSVFRKLDVHPTL